MDYVPLQSHPLEFSRGSTLNCARIQLLTDSIAEGHEVFIVSMTTSDPSLLPGEEIVIMLRDNDSKIIIFSKYIWH